MLILVDFTNIETFDFTTLKLSAYLDSFLKDFEFKNSFLLNKNPEKNL